MKKTLALVLLLILAMGVFAACNQVQPTERKTRWGENETWTYNISLLNTNPSNINGADYYRDFLAIAKTPMGLLSMKNPQNMTVNDKPIYYNAFWQPIQEKFVHSQ